MVELTTIHHHPDRYLETGAQWITLKHAGTPGRRDSLEGWVNLWLVIIICLTPAQTPAQSDSKPGQARELHLHCHTKFLK